MRPKPARGRGPSARIDARAEPRIGPPMPDANRLRRLCLGRPLPEGLPQGDRMRVSALPRAAPAGRARPARLVAAWDRRPARGTRTGRGTRVPWAGRPDLRVD